MKLLYPEEHVNCLNYEASFPVEFISLTKGQEWKIDTSCNLIVLLTEGKVNYILNDGENYETEGGKAFAISSYNYVNFTAIDDSKLIIFKLYDRMQLCYSYSLEKLMLKPVEISEMNSVLDANLSPSYLVIDERLSGYLSLLENYVTSGLKCFYFYKIKIQEFFFILRAYYSKKELYEFLKPLVMNNSSFSNFVYNNYKKVKTVKELADIANYSLSGFQKHFKKVFGVPAYQWLKNQRSKSIYHELNCSERTLKDISNEYGFSSPSHFNDFCKGQFGQTPGHIRKNK